MEEKSENQFDIYESALMKAKPKSIRRKVFMYFIGIDVSKNELDYAVFFKNKLLFHRDDKNSPEAILAFVSELKKISGFTMANSIFCMENTGIYCNHLLKYLTILKANIVVGNPLQIKNSFGLIRGKSDKIDAIRIAKYAQCNKNELIFWTDKRPVLLHLMAFSSLRSRLLSLSVALNNPLKEQAIFFDSDLRDQSLSYCLKSAAALRSDLEQINVRINELVNTDPELKRIKQLITSVPGVGIATAIQVIIATNEFKDIRDPKKFACYAGVAPFQKESGVNKGKARVSHFANKKVKTLLHICAVSAVRFDKELKAYFERKTKDEGKPKMLVYNAVRNKLVLRIFACLNQDRCFVKEYINPNNSGEEKELVA